MAEVQTSTAEKNTSSTLVKATRTTSRVLTKVSGGEKGVTGHIKTAVNTGKEIHNYYKGEYVKSGITGNKPTIATGVKHLVHKEVVKGKVKIAEGKIALAKASVGDYSDIAKGSLKASTTVTKKSTKVAAKVTRISSVVADVQEKGAKYYEDKSRQITTRVATKPIRWASKKYVGKPLNEKVVKPVTKKVKKKLKSTAKKATQTVTKTTKYIVTTTKNVIGLLMKLVSNIVLPMITAIISTPILLIPLLCAGMLIGVIGAIGASEQSSENGILSVEEVKVDFNSKYYTFDATGINGSLNVCDKNNHVGYPYSGCLTHSYTGSWNKMICSSYASSRFWEINYPDETYPLPANWDQKVSIDHVNPNPEKFDYSTKIEDVKPKSILTIKYGKNKTVLHAVFVEGIANDGSCVISEANATKDNQYGFRVRKFTSIEAFLASYGATVNGVLSPKKAQE